MSDRLPGSSASNPLYHRGFAIWSATDDRDRQIFIWCHPSAEMDDLYDRRHGDAPSLHQARKDIDNFLAEQAEIAAQRSLSISSLTDNEIASIPGGIR